MDLRRRTGKTLGPQSGEIRFLRPQAVLAFSVEPKAGVSQSGIGESKIGVLLQCLLKQRNRLPNSGGVVAVAQNVATLEIKIVGLQIFGGVSAAPAQFLIAGFQFKRADDTAVNLVLKS